MIKRTKIVVKWFWGWGVFCDQCKAQLTRHRPKRKRENIPVKDDEVTLCAKCERAESKVQNEAIRAEKKAQKQAQEKAARVREQTRLRVRDHRERQKA
jgi:hypothetical protein